MLDVFAEATFGPAFGAVERFNVIFVGVGEGSELVKSHVDIRTNATLDLHGFFRTNKIGLAVGGVDEADAFFGNVGEAFFVGGVGDVAFFFHGDDFAEAGAERHDLEATGVGEGGAEPRSMRSYIFVLGCDLWRFLGIGFRGRYPFSQPSSFSDFGGLATEVVAVGEHSLGSEGVEVFGGDETDVAIGANAHEGGGFDFSVGGFDDAGATETVRKSFLDDEFHVIIIA